MQHNTIENIMDRILAFYEFNPPFYEISMEMLELSLMLEEYFEISFRPDSLIGLGKKGIIHLVHMLKK